jgi:hypothetical protein
MTQLGGVDRVLETLLSSLCAAKAQRELLRVATGGHSTAALITAAPAGQGIRGLRSTNQNCSAHGGGPMRRNYGPRRVGDLARIAGSRS